MVNILHNPRYHIVASEKWSIFSHRFLELNNSHVLIGNLGVANYLAPMQVLETVALFESKWDTRSLIKQGLHQHALPGMPHEACDTVVQHGSPKLSLLRGKAAMKVFLSFTPRSALRINGICIKGFLRKLGQNLNARNQQNCVKCWDVMILLDVYRLFPHVSYQSKSERLYRQFHDLRFFQSLSNLK